MAWKDKALTFLLVLGMSCATAGDKFRDNKMRRGLDCEVETIVKRDQSFYACKEDVDQYVLSTMDLVSEVKQFGREFFGVVRTDNYTVYKKNSEQNKIKWSYSLYISPRDVLPEHFWYQRFDSDQKFREDIDYPLAIYSYVDTLVDEKGYYEKNYDVMYRQMSDYSPGAVITPYFVDSSLDLQVENTLHEDWHFTLDELIGSAVDMVVHESTATFVGVMGSAEFSKVKFGVESEAFKEAVRRCDVVAEDAAKLDRLYRKLSDLYSRSDISYEEKLAMKSTLITQASLKDPFGWGRLNNASVRLLYNYMKLYPALYKLHKEFGWEKTKDVLRHMPPTDAAASAYIMRQFPLPIPPKKDK